MNNQPMLNASSELINQAEDELLLKGENYSQLAEKLTISTQLVDNFFNGEIIDIHTYNLICNHLGLEPNSSSETIPDIQEDNDISLSDLLEERNDINQDDYGDFGIDFGQDHDLYSDNQNIVIDQLPLDYTDIDVILPIIRQRISANLINQCDRLRIIDINTPLYLHDLYTEINLFNGLLSSQYLDHSLDDIDEPDRRLNQLILDNLSLTKISADQALDESKQILLVGGLGSGKTTLLKYWAIACITEQILPECLPIFVSLRSQNSVNDLQNPVAWLKQQLNNYGLSDELLSNHILEQLISQGRLLLLLDGLYDVPEMQRAEVARQILQFCDRYPDNRVVVTSRNPIYSHALESFLALEIAPFDSNQISIFVQKWFRINCLESPQKTTDLEQLLVKNPALREIAENPLFLTYLCNVFKNQKSIGTSFYREIIDLLLTTWEETKCLLVPPASELSTAQKLDLLSHVAIAALDRRGYIWKSDQLAKDFQACIIANKNIASNINHSQIIQELKWQHGLLTEPAKGIHTLSYAPILHDYLAAHRLAHSRPHIVQKYLLERIHLKHWHGAMIMSLSILPEAEQILLELKKRIDQSISKEPHLQAFLTWVDFQANQMHGIYKTVTIRALYLDIDLEKTRALDRARALDVSHTKSLERAKKRSMGIENTMNTEMDVDHAIHLAINLDLALYFSNHRVLELASALDPILNQGLQALRQELPNPHENRTKFAKWWQVKGLEWSKSFRSLIIQHRKGSQAWHFTEEQTRLLRIYHDANKLLINCLNNAEHISPLVKEQIESSLFLPLEVPKLASKSVSTSRAS